MVEKIWKVCKDYPNYSVSTEGEVKNNLTGLYLTGTDNGLGYLRVNLSNGIKRVKVFIHRLVAIAFIDNLENKPQVNHIDRVKYNNFANNLEWVTQFENMNHEKIFGHIKSYKQLTDLDAIEIRKQSQLGVSGNQLAKNYKVDRSTIMRILQNKSHRKLNYG
jgi:hypothetical protein